MEEKKIMNKGEEAFYEYVAGRLKNVRWEKTVDSIFMDDTIQRIKCYGTFKHITTEHVISVLK